MKRLQAIFGAIMFVSGAMPASAQSLSSKPIRIVVPVAAGAATDLLGRMAGDWLGKQTGVPDVVENRTGAGGKVALRQGAKAEPDRQTRLAPAQGAITINRAMLKKDPVDTLNDIVPVAPLAQFPQLLVINSKVKARTARALIALAKANPETINYGSAGVGSTPHLTLALFSRLTGVELVHMPYRGLAPAVTDLVAGTIQAIAIG